MSVMLGTVVAMMGFLIAHLSAAGAKLAGRAGGGGAGGAPAHGLPTLAITFMATRPTPAWCSFSRAGPHSAAEAKLYCAWTTSSLASMTRSTIGRQRVRAHADEPHLALLFGLALRLHQIVGDQRRVVLAVEQPHVQVVGVGAP